MGKEWRQDSVTTNMFQFTDTKERRMRDKEEGVEVGERHHTSHFISQ